MAKPRILFLTTVTTEISESGQERINKFNSTKEPRDSNGWTREKWEDLGLPPPKELLEEDEELNEGVFKLRDEELEYIHNSIILERSRFSFAIDSETDGLTTVFTKEGLSMDVLEDTENIFTQLHMIDRNIFEYCIEEIKWRVKKIFKKEKDLVLEAPKE